MFLMLKQLDKLKKRCEQLEDLLASQEVASNPEQYKSYAKELSEIRPAVDLYSQYRKLCLEVEELKAILKQKHDREFIELVDNELAAAVEKKSAVEEKIKQALDEDDEDAGKNVIFEIRPGTGGLEASLFAADLYRMYVKYASDRGWIVEQMSLNNNDLGGIKEATFSVKGKDAYRRLKFESGVHRVQRVPETEAQGRVHTSTATVAVLVEPGEVDFTIDAKDLRIDTYRSSGPGGQHMQKTDSAVRITHIPTGVAVACQDERSQMKNKSKAMRILRAKLHDAKIEAEAKKISQERRVQVGSGDRSEKIRTYNFPDRRVTDHRINFTVHNLEAVLEGDLGGITDALLKARKQARTQ